MTNRNGIPHSLDCGGASASDNYGAYSPEVLMQPACAHSNYRYRPPKFLKTIVLASSAALALACTDSRDSGAGMTRPAERYGASIIGADTEWNRLVIEMTLSRERAARPGAAVLTRVGTPSHRVHIERSLRSGGWETEVAFARDLRTPDDSASVAKVRLDASGSVLAAYDTRGGIVDVPTQTGPRHTLADVTRLAVSLVAPGARDRVAASAHSLRSTDALRVVTSGRPATAGTSAANRVWLDQFIVTPASRERTLARLQRQYGTPVDESGGEAHYRAVRGGVVRDEVFDRSIGAVVREVLSTDQGLRIRVTRVFAPAGNGRYVVRQLLTEYPARDGSLTRLKQEFTTVRVEALAQ